LALKKVVVIDTGYDSYEYERALLTEAGYEFAVFAGEREDRRGKMAFANGATAIFARHTRMDEHFFRSLPGLKALVRYGIGYDNIDLDAASRFGVKVANVQGYANHAVSDHALALMYGCARCLPLGESVLQEKFGVPPRRSLPDFHLKTLGIIGLGRIGGTLCKKATALFRWVLACDPYIPDSRFAECGAIKTDLETLLTASDVISLHCNLTVETTGLIGRDAFSLMEKRPILINTARGPVVDQESLLEALRDETIHSAGLDVYSVEPPGPDQQNLLRHPHVISTGHYAWYSESSIIELQRRATHNMLALLNGETPPDCLNP
jgi:D-3-phosphoglycerate dehydrogenase